MTTQKEMVHRHNIHEPITITTDDVERRDILERRHLAGRILNRLEEEDCPSVLGIYGGWGTGKTSVLELMCGLNADESPQSNKKKVHVEIIDAWRYEGTGNLLIPIIVKLRELSGVKEFIQCWKVMTKRVVALTGLSLIEAALKTASPIGIADIDDLYEKIKGREDKNYATVLLDWERVVDDMSKEQEAFETIVGLVNKAQQCDKLILCIDNLDRCTPEKVITLLESIKLFLSVPNCMWLFAMDSEVIASYIDRKYDGTRMDGYSYLDKIVPEQYHLSLSPAVDGRNIVKLLRYAAGGNVADFDFGEEKIPQIPKVLVPRKLIKSARKFADFYRMPRAGGSASPDMVFYLSLLYHTWPDFYQRLSSTSRDHICAILDNFFPREENSQEVRLGDSKKTIREVITLDKKYSEDHDLFHFLKMTFKDYGSSRNAVFVEELIDGMTGLRLTGLP
jgi:hypothetical protein